MLNKPQQFGKESESIAIRHLKKNGYKILEQNYRNKLGEIDIIAKDKDTLVFIEVKARKSGRFGNPKWARFDVVSILSAEKNPDIEIVKNAFELAYT